MAFYNSIIVKTMPIVTNPIPPCPLPKTISNRVQNLSQKISRVNLPTLIAPTWWKLIKLDKIQKIYSKM